MCAIQSTGEEIAAQFQMDYDTFNSRCIESMGISFSELFKLWRQPGKSSLRRAQFEKATVEKDTRMQIWLGKQMLDQKEQVVSANIDIPVPQYMVERDVTESADNPIEATIQVSEGQS